MYIFIIYFIALSLWGYSFFSVLTNTFENKNNKIIWLLLLIFLPISAIIYPFIGKKQLVRKISDNINIKNSTNKKSKILAIALTVLNIGLGYLYIGNLKKALIYMLGFPIFVYISYYLSSYYSNIYTIFLVFSLFFFIYAYVIYELLVIIINKETKSTKFNRWYFLILFLLSSGIYLYCLKSYLPLKYLSQSSSSMNSTIIKGDSFLIREDKSFVPNRGDIVLFKYPNNENIFYLKRCVATGGDIVAMKDKHLLLHPKEGNEFVKANYPKDNIIEVGDKLWVLDPYKIDHPGIHNDAEIVNNGLNPMELFNMRPIIIPADEIFMMGDNRDHSNDSRFWGTVSQNQIIGNIKNIFINFNDFKRSGSKLK